jgi:predicted Fe-S protein YdhL (DUF1289 family)
MSATLLSELTVSQARRRLNDTSRMSPEQVGELEKIVAAFHAARPTNRACVACGSMRWSEHATADGDASWACAGCHRPASLTVEEWHALVDAEARRIAIEAEARAATEPAPRDQLTAALARRAESRHDRVPPS